MLSCNNFATLLDPPLVLLTTSISQDMFEHDWYSQYIIHETQTTIDTRTLEKSTYQGFNAIR